MHDMGTRNRGDWGGRGVHATRAWLETSNLSKYLESKVRAETDISFFFLTRNAAKNLLSSTTMLLPTFPPPFFYGI